MATPKESEKNFRKFAEKQIDKGKEYEAFQKGQTELMGIQAQRQQALQERALQDNADLSQQQIMAQAAELGAMTAAGGGGKQVVLGQQVAAMNPQTQATLGKYGVPVVAKPGVTSNRSVQKTPQNITVNNTNTTNNKITITQPNIPMKPVVVNNGQDQGGISKFKTWMSNVFAQQKEQKTLRDKEYQKKEWSLERSSSRLTRTLEKVGKTIGETLDPRKLVSGSMSQLKMLFLMIGLHRLPKMWKQMSEFTEKAKGWFQAFGRFFGFGEGNSWDDSGLRQGILGFLGAQEGESISEAFRNLFLGKGKGDGSYEGMGLFPYLLDRLKKMFNFEERWKAIQNVKWPENDSKSGLGWPLSGLFDGLKGVMSDLGDYIKNVLTALFTGKTPVPKHAIKAVQKEADEEMKDHRGNWSHDNSVNYNKSSNTKGVSLGDAASFGLKGKDYQNWIENGDVDKEGNLSNSYGSAFRQSAAVAGMLTSEHAGDNIGGIMTGLGRLKQASEKEEGVVVHNDFLNALENIGLSRDTLNNLGVGSKKKVKLVAEDRDSADWNQWSDTTKEWQKDFNERYFENKSVGQFVWNLGKNVVNAPLDAAKAIYAAGDVISTDIKNLGRNGQVLKMVDASDPRPGYDVDGNPSDKTYEVNVLYKSDFDKIEAELAKLSNLDSFSIGLDDANAAAWIRQESVKNRKEKLQKKWEDPKAWGKYHNDREVKGYEKDTWMSTGLPKAVDSIGDSNISGEYNWFLEQGNKKIQEAQQSPENKSSDEGFFDHWEETRPGRAQSFALGTLSNATNNVADWIQDEFNWDVRSSFNKATGKARDLINVATSYFTGIDSRGRLRGNIKYNQTGARDIDKGSADCSSFVAGVYKKAGVDLGDPKLQNSETLWKNNKGETVDFGSINEKGYGKSSRINESKLQPGDVLFFRRDSSKNVRPYGVGHVGIYVGNGKYVDHGGGADGNQPGPVLKDLQFDKDNYVGAKRYVNTSESSPVTNEVNRVANTANTNTKNNQSTTSNTKSTQPTSSQTTTSNTKNNQSTSSQTTTSTPNNTKSTQPGSSKTTTSTNNVDTKGNVSNLEYPFNPFGRTSWFKDPFINNSSSSNTYHSTKNYSPLVIDNTPNEDPKTENSSDSNNTNNDNLDNTSTTSVQTTQDTSNSSNNSSEPSSLIDSMEEFEGLSKNGLSLLLGAEGWFDASASDNQGKVGTDAVAGKVKGVANKNLVAVGPGLTNQINSIPGIPKPIVEGEKWTAAEIWQAFKALQNYRYKHLTKVGASVAKYGQHGMDALMYLYHWKPAVAVQAVKNSNNSQELSEWIDKNVDMSKEAGTNPTAKSIKRVSNLKNAISAIAGGKVLADNPIYNAYTRSGNLNNIINSSLPIYNSTGIPTLDSGGIFGWMGNMMEKVGNAISSAFDLLPEVKTPEYGSWKNLSLEQQVSKYKEKTGKDPRELANGDPMKLSQILSDFDPNFEYRIRENTRLDGDRYILARRLRHEIPPEIKQKLEEKAEAEGIPKDQRGNYYQQFFDKLYANIDTEKIDLSKFSDEEKVNYYQKQFDNIGNPLAENAVVLDPETKKPIKTEEKKEPEKVEEVSKDLPEKTVNIVKNESSKEKAVPYLDLPEKVTLTPELQNIIGSGTGDDFGSLVADYFLNGSQEKDKLSPEMKVLVEKIDELIAATKGIDGSNYIINQTNSSSTNYQTKQVPGLA